MNPEIPSWLYGAGHFSYLAILVVALAYPLAQSFEHRLKFWTQWRYLFPALIPQLVFLVFFDVLFTYMGVWSFNPDFVLGIWLINLPVEEWLFFIVAPYACAFIYDCIRYFFKPDIWKGFAKPLSIVLLILFVAVGVLNIGKWYTSVKFLSAAVILAWHWWWMGDKYLGRFYVSFLFSLLGFALVNGFLTVLPVVSYDVTQQLDIRWNDLIPVPYLNIPIEDTAYCFQMLLMTMTFYEYFREKSEKGATNQPLALFRQ